MLKFLRVFYLLLAIALLPMHARAMEFAHLQTQNHASCAPATCGAHADCGNVQTGHGASLPGHMDGDCCQLHLGTLPELAQTVLPVVSAPVIARVATPPSPTQIPPERPPRV